MTDDTLCQLAHIIKATCLDLKDPERTSCEGVMVLFAEGKVPKEEFEKALKELGVDEKFLDARKRYIGGDCD